MVENEFVRPARPDDRDAVLALLTGEGLEAEFLAREFVVCEVGGRIVACARARRLPEGGTEFSSLVVAPSHRGRGLSRELFAMALLGARHPVFALTLVPDLARRAGFEPIPSDSLPGSLRTKASSCDVAVRPWRPMRLRRQPVAPLPTDAMIGAPDFLED